MSKKKVNKGQALDLSDVEVGLRAVLPKGPAERDPGDEGRFQRDYGRRDRDSGFGGGFGGGRSEDSWSRGSRAYDDRGGRGGGFDDRGPPRRDEDAPWQRGSGRSSGGGGGGGGYDRGYDRGGYDRGSGGFDDPLPSAPRPRLNLQPRTAPVERQPAPSGGSTSSAPPADKPVDKWSALERTMGGGSSSSGGDGGFRGGRDDWRGGSSGSGDFRRGGGSSAGPPRPSGRFAFVENEPRESRRDDGYDRRDDGFGRRDDGFGRRDDGYGRRDDGYGRRDDGYGRRDEGRRDFGRGDGGYYERAGGRSQAPPPAPPAKTEEELAAEAAAAEEAKRAAEEAKRAAEEEAQRKAEEEARKKQEEEQAAAEAARLTQEQEGAATQLATSGKLGKDLVALAQSLSHPLGVRLTCDAILANVDVANGTWFTGDQYGALLKHMCAGSSSSDKAKKQAEIIYSAQAAFHKIKFPRNDEGDGLIQKLFFALYNDDIVEEDGFQEWRYAEDDDHIPGKLNALTQTNEFLLWLDEPDEEEEEDEEEED